MRRPGTLLSLIVRPRQPVSARRKTSVLSIFPRFKSYAETYTLFLSVLHHRNGPVAFGRNVHSPSAAAGLGVAVACADDGLRHRRHRIHRKVFPRTQREKAKRPRGGTHNRRVDIRPINPSGTLTISVPLGFYYSSHRRADEAVGARAKRQNASVTPLRSDARVDGFTSPTNG